MINIKYKNSLKLNCNEIYGMFVVDIKKSVYSLMLLINGVM